MGGEVERGWWSRRVEMVPPYMGRETRMLAQQSCVVIALTVQHLEPCLRRKRDSGILQEPGS